MSITFSSEDSLLLSFIFFITFILKLWIKCFVSSQLVVLFFSRHRLIRSSYSMFISNRNHSRNHNILCYFSTRRVSSVLGCVLVMWSIHNLEWTLWPTPQFLLDICSRPGFMGLRPAQSRTFRNIPLLGFSPLPSVLKFLRTLPVGFCLVSQVIWDSAGCIPAWSLGHPRSSYSGWVLGPAPQLSALCFLMLWASAKIFLFLSCDYWCPLQGRPPGDMTIISSFPL